MEREDSEMSEKMSDRPEDVATEPPGAGDVLRKLVSDPLAIIGRWNWKSAVLSALIRGSIFFVTNLSEGARAATAAFAIESSFYIVTAGFYGAIIESFRRVRPYWQAVVTVTVLVPLINHSLEFLFHWIGGTKRIALGVAVSMVFSLFSANFNLYIMSRGALIVGSGREPLWKDLLRMPRLLLEFLLFVLRIPGARG